MFKIESYVTPILLSYVDKYVKDFKPGDAQVSLWGGGVALHNLVLKTDILQNEVSLPFTLLSGRIHELHIQVPWTKIMSEPIVVTIDTIECILNLHPPANEESETPDGARNAPVVETPPGYMQALVRKIVSNIVLKVHHLILKTVEDDIVLSLNVKYMDIRSADADWEPAFADIDKVLRRLIRLEDLTLCLDKADADGKIRTFAEPLLYRCKLDFRVLSDLVSSSVRGAKSLLVEARSSRLAWSVSEAQLSLLLRLAAACCPPRPPSPPPRAPPAHVAAASSSPEDADAGTSWSDWAYSWLPYWAEAESAEPTPLRHVPIPVHFTVCFDVLSLAFKILDSEVGGRRKTRSIMDIVASHTVLKGVACAPTVADVYVAARTLAMRSSGKCVCGYVNFNELRDRPTYYVRTAGAAEDDDGWQWPAETFAKVTVDGPQSEERRPPADEEEMENPLKPNKSQEKEKEQGKKEETPPLAPEPVKRDLWTEMNPVLFVHYVHGRSPQMGLYNENVELPTDFEYSDWAENVTVEVAVRPLVCIVTMGLLHRLRVVTALVDALKDIKMAEAPPINKHPLTVEEMEALLDNLPQRHVQVTVTGLCVQMLPYEHSPTERAAPPELTLDLDVPRAEAMITTPLYPNRVCAAASQLPKMLGPLWQASKMQITVRLDAVQVNLSPFEAAAAAAAAAAGRSSRPVARADLKCMLQTLMHREYFETRRPVVTSYSVVIKEANVCGSYARLGAAAHVLRSMLERRASHHLRRTTLSRDALNDQRSVIIDMTAEDFCQRGYLTQDIMTHIMTLNSIRCTALQANHLTCKQAWLLSGPDVHISSPLVTMAAQWCARAMDDALDYLGLWTEPISLSMDPLLVAWLAYAPRPLPQPTQQDNTSKARVSSSLFLKRRASTVVSRGVARSAKSSGHSSEPVHGRAKSQDSSSEASDAREIHTAGAKSRPTLNPDRVLPLYDRLRRVLLTVELGVVVVYWTKDTVSAVGCETIRETMEMHAINDSIVVLSLGRLIVHSSAANKHFWQEIKHDGPTYIDGNAKHISEESFPWKLRLADMGCHIMEARAAVEVFRRRPGEARSQLKAQEVLHTTILELVTSSVTVDVVTKDLQLHQPDRGHRVTQEPKKDPTEEEKKIMYFTSGADFTPTTLGEFLRGPAGRQKKKKDEEEEKEKAKTAEKAAGSPKLSPRKRPHKDLSCIISLGVNIHADTPPIIVKLNHEQLEVIGSLVHGVHHLAAALRVPWREGPSPPPAAPYSSVGGPPRSVRKSISEDFASNSMYTAKKDFVPIFESPSVVIEKSFKTSFLMQWVINRVTVAVMMADSKVVASLDDIIVSVDLQKHYNQLKTKIGHASLKYYERLGFDEWKVGQFGGRIFEALEPPDSTYENHFLSLTITEATISALPESWKEDLGPKLLQTFSGHALDVMWEIYASISPVEVVLHPAALRHLLVVVNDMSPRVVCAPPQVEDAATDPCNWQWPYIYVVAGGLRVLVITEEPINGTDTIVVSFGKCDVTPLPTNPICRRSLLVGADNTWSSSGNEGRQYEAFLKGVSVYSTNSANFKGKDNLLENAALKWTQAKNQNIYTPILHEIQIGCVVAPPFYLSGILAGGPAAEVNVVSACTVDLCLLHLQLFRCMADEMTQVFESSQHTSAHELHDEICHYQQYINETNNVYEVTDTEVAGGEARASTPLHASRDSGLETLRSEPRAAPQETPPKKIADDRVRPSDHLEVYLTLDAATVSLYACDDGDPLVSQLQRRRDKEDVMTSDRHEHYSAACQKVEKSRAQTNLDMVQAKKDNAGETVHLLYISFYQSNVYYWRRKTQRTLQATLFNFGCGLGSEPSLGRWGMTLVSTTPGTADRLTGIPPSLLTFKYIVGLGPTEASSRANVTLDIERPVMLELCPTRIEKLFAVSRLLNETFQAPCMKKTKFDKFKRAVPKLPHVDHPLHRLRQRLVEARIDGVTVRTGQVGLIDREFAAGWARATLQAGAGARPDRLTARASVAGLLASVGAPTDVRQTLLQPLMLGMELQATWDAWHRGDVINGLRETPILTLLIDVDHVTLDLRPEDLVKIDRLLESVHAIRTSQEQTVKSEKEKQKEPIREESKLHDKAQEDSDIFYKDDLRSGVFKTLGGSRGPLAYQAVLGTRTVTWRYPSPRAVVKIVAYPIPSVHGEVRMALEHCSAPPRRWEPLAYFNLPLNEPLVHRLDLDAPVIHFATLWRLRVCDRDGDTAWQKKSFIFNLDQFLPRPDPLGPGPGEEDPPEDTIEYVSTSQLAGAIRVDSYYSPLATPRASLAARVAELQVNAHLPPPDFVDNAAHSHFEGYYLSRPLMKGHRVLSLSVRAAALDVLRHAHTGGAVLLDAVFSSDILECDSGTLERLSDDARAQVALSSAAGRADRARLRVRCSPLRVRVDVPRLRTAQCLVGYWMHYARQIKSKRRAGASQHALEDSTTTTTTTPATDEELLDRLEGRVSLWIHNTCGTAMRVGQDDTDQMMPIGSGSKLAYRWRSPEKPKLLRFTNVIASTDWKWSKGVEFAAGRSFVRIGEAGGERAAGGAVHLYTSVEERAAARVMTLSGRLVLVNLLRFQLHYMLKTRCARTKVWSSLHAGELDPETLGKSIVCDADSEMVLKIKLSSSDSGWSGDIPLKECPKSNVPWLVKIPSQGQVPYVSVWCRVTRAQSDGRMLASVWPLYVVRSHLSLDVDVIISSDLRASGPGALPDAKERALPPLVQSAPGKGGTAHLMPPGTTASRHSLVLKYRNIDCPVTVEPISLHYGVTDNSVFEKRVVVNTIDEVLAQIKNWLDTSSRDSKSEWPYSRVGKHFSGELKAGLMQPRSDIAVHYGAVMAGGGCCLEMRLCPCVMMCNATPMALTVRGHDATPVCKLEPGSSMAQPSVLVKKPFYLSLEVNYESFVSRELSVWHEEPGQYGTAPGGRVALGRHTDVVVHCNHKVALLTMYYEIRKSINILGVVSTYEVINKLPFDICVGAVVLPQAMSKVVPLRFPSFTVIAPVKEDSMRGVPMCFFRLIGVWPSRHGSEVRPYLGVALRAAAASEGAAPAAPAAPPLPYSLGGARVRQPLTLLDADGASHAIVVTRQRRDGRWLVTVAADPCPQFHVVNESGRTLAVAESAAPPGAPPAAKADFEDVEWQYRLEPGARLHYSTPTHCARYPPAARPPDRAPCYITFADCSDVITPEWCPPLSVTPGVQLLQLGGRSTIKLRVSPRPHSTLLLLMDTNQHDISASDIRKRLGETSLVDTTVLDHPRPLGASKLTIEGLSPTVPDSTDSSKLKSNLKVAFQDVDSYDSTNDFTKLDENVEIADNSKTRNQNTQKSTEIGEFKKNESTNKDLKEISDKSAKSSNKPVISDNEKNKDDQTKSNESENVASTSTETSTPQPHISGKALDKDYMEKTQEQSELSSSKDTSTPNSSEISSETESTIISLEKKTSEKVASTSQETPSTSVVPESTKLPESEDDKLMLEAEDTVTENKPYLVPTSTKPQTISELLDYMEVHRGLEKSSSDFFGSTLKASAESTRPRAEVAVCVIDGVTVELAAVRGEAPLLAVHLDRAACLVSVDAQGTEIEIAIAEVQVDNLQYDSGLYDFGVIASTLRTPFAADPWLPPRTVLHAKGVFDLRTDGAHAYCRLKLDRWTVPPHDYHELTEVELRVGPVALYIEDAYVLSLAALLQQALPPPAAAAALAEADALRRPLRLRLLHIHPVDVTLTLHTAMRVYIALDHSPLSLSAFKLHDVMTSAERLTRALTVHYLSAAVLGAGWVVGGLELLGAPGAVASRVGAARGGVRAVAAATAAALVRSFSAWAGSLARNLDILAGDEEHARRAAAARRRPPPTLLAGLTGGLANFAVNMLGAVGGLAHHPVVGVCSGEASGGAALRRAVLGALTKPVSATADLLASAGAGLLSQTGWEPHPLPRPRVVAGESNKGWDRNCVRWTFRLAELEPFIGFEALLGNNAALVLLTHKFMVVVDPGCEVVLEMIDLRHCTLPPYSGAVVELRFDPPPRRSKVEVPEDEENVMSPGTLARVAQFVGAPPASTTRALMLLPAPGRSLQLHAALAALLHACDPAHIALL